MHSSLDHAAAPVRVWYTRVRDPHPALRAAWHAVLTPQERAQQQRFLFEKDRRRYLVTRALVRDVLGRCIGVPPQAVRFETGEHGKPRLAGSFPWQFNLSHTDDLVIVAVTVGRALGIDVENVQRRAPLDISERYFTARESAALRRLPASAQAQRFWALWTLKESYIKAQGMGLAIPLDRFYFELGEPGRVQIGFADGWADDPARWDVRLFRPTAQHQAALCIERPGAGGAALYVQVQETTPLTSFGRSAAPMLMHEPATVVFPAAI